MIYRYQLYVEEVKNLSGKIRRHDENIWPGFLLRIHMNRPWKI